MERAPSYDLLRRLLSVVKFSCGVITFYNIPTNFMVNLSLNLDSPVGCVFKGRKKGCRVPLPLFADKRLYSSFENNPTAMIFKYFTLQPECQPKGERSMSVAAKAFPKCHVSDI